MKKSFAGIVTWLGVATCSIAAPAPAELTGATVVLDYSGAEFYVENPTVCCSEWVPMQKLSDKEELKEVFAAAGVPPKSMRRMLPISAPGEGGIYTYRCKDSEVGEIEVDMWQSKQLGVLRFITLNFTSPTTAVATEKLYHDYSVAMTRNVAVKIYWSGMKDDSLAKEAGVWRRELETKRYTRLVLRVYRSRLLELLRRMEAGESVNITHPDSRGGTALHLACELSYVELVRWLLSHGADVSARTERGVTPADCVDGPHAAEIRKLLNQSLHAE